MSTAILDKWDIKRAYRGYFSVTGSSIRRRVYLLPLYLTPLIKSNTTPMERCVSDLHHLPYLVEELVLITAPTRSLPFRSLFYPLSFAQ